MVPNVTVAPISNPEPTIRSGVPPLIEPVLTDSVFTVGDSADGTAEGAVGGREDGMLSPLQPARPCANTATMAQDRND